MAQRKIVQKIDFQAGITIEQAIEHAIYLARAEGIPVLFQFNGVHIILTKESMINDIFRDWLVAINEDIPGIVGPYSTKKGREYALPNKRIFETPVEAKSGELSNGTPLQEAPSSHALDLAKTLVQMIEMETGQGKTLSDIFSTAYIDSGDIGTRLLRKYQIKQDAVAAHHERERERRLKEIEEKLRFSLPIKVKDKEGWKAFCADKSDISLLALRWAGLMEWEMAQGKLLSDVYLSALIQADIDQKFDETCKLAGKALFRFWEHGKKLEKCLNWEH